MLSFLKINMPYCSSLKTRFLMSFFYGLIPTLLLFILNPFNLGVFFQFNRQFTFGYGLVAFSYLFLVFSIIKYIYLKDKIWNIHRVLLLYVFILLTVSFLMLKYHLLGKDLSYYKNLSYLNMLSMVFLITLMPTIIVRLVISITENKPQSISVDNEAKLNKIDFKTNKNNSNTTLESNIKKLGFGNKNEILIKSILIKEKDIRLNSDAILYIKSDNNYCHVYYLNENSIVENKMMRITLKQVENQLEGFDMFFRCHNSHIINKNKVIEVIGNSTNRKIKIVDSDYLVPISRKIDFDF